jgi:starch phosphorylase
MINAKLLYRDLCRILKARHFVTPKEASPHMLIEATAQAALLQAGDAWTKSRSTYAKHRHAAYLSAEFLTGRLILNNLLNLGVLDELKALFAASGADITLLEEEADPALGNGGLGRLAACFLDSAASMDAPLMGYGLKYRYGLFRQKIQGLDQAEEPDEWLTGDDNWSVRREEDAVLVPLKDFCVKAVPYDMPVFGYKTDTVGTLRLWQTESLHEFDFALFNDYKYDEASLNKNRAEDITRVLYPNDWDDKGRLLRLRQEYVLSSATMQDLIRLHERSRRPLRQLPRFLAVQLNDTHPVLAIPEMIRLLMQKGVSFDYACRMAQQTFAFTNHTVMPEALEKWSMQLIGMLSDEISAILKRLDKRAKRQCGLALIKDGRVSMADLAVYMSCSVNGVARIHSELVKTRLFPDWYKLYPERFNNKTNGVTQRRWLALCNPELTALLQSKADGDCIKDLGCLSGIKPDPQLAKALLQVKRLKKQQLSAWLKLTQGVDIPDSFIFDIQIKRIHEYKRQLLNALSILMLYNRLKDNPNMVIQPRTYIFGAKAAPGYYRAKLIIRLINEIARLVNSDPVAGRYINVVFVENYCVSVAEDLIPAADVSEQLSTAGKEASGTGCMKFMYNGAVTLGTLDGANVEIKKQVGDENIAIFGLTPDEVLRYYQQGGYIAYDTCNSDPRLQKICNQLVDGTYGGLSFYGIHDALFKANDEYFVLKDFDSYLKAFTELSGIYQDPVRWGRMSLANIAMAGEFTTDRTIFQYCDDIWKIPCDRIK